MKAQGGGNGKGGQAKCPNCGEPAVTEFRPFCCKRCADLDLGRWFNESYRIATVDEDDFDDGNDGA